MDYKINFQGRIALSPSIRFGLGGVLFLYLLQPLFERLVGLMGDKCRQIVFYITAGILVLDCLYTFLLK